MIMFVLSEHGKNDLRENIFRNGLAIIVTYSIKMFRLYIKYLFELIFDRKIRLVNVVNLVNVFDDVVIYI